MSNAFILDLLFIVFVLLFSLIGFWRGVVKEGMAAGGILFGALLAENWSARLGAVGSNLLNITQNASRFLAMEALLVAFALIVGYGSGSLLVPPVRGLGRRLGGGVLGAVNGAFLLAFSLRAAHDEIARANAQRLLHDSRLSWLLINRFNWFLLVVAAVVLVMLFGRLVTERESSVERSSPWRGERRAARLPAPTEAAKLEPASRGFDAASERFQADAPALSDTAPISVDIGEISHDRSQPSIQPRRSPMDEASGKEWQVIRFSSDLTAPIPVADPQRCANCGAEIARDDIFCAGCGQAIKTTEEKDDHDE